MANLYSIFNAYTRNNLHVRRIHFSEICCKIIYVFFFCKYMFLLGHQSYSYSYSSLAEKCVLNNTLVTEC
jgi:hypothetical protein